MFNKILVMVSFATVCLAGKNTFAAEQVDLLIKNATVLTMDEDRNVYPNGLVAVQDNVIVAVTDGSNLEEFEAKKVIDADGDIVLPGLINTHTHVSMTVFRSLADDVPDRLHRQAR